MSIRNTLKMLIRSSLRTLLTFTLLAAASFALLSRVGEYAVTSAALAQAAEQYRGIGTIYLNNPRSTFDTREDIMLGASYLGFPHSLRDGNLKEHYFDKNYNNYFHKAISTDVLGKLSDYSEVDSIHTQYMTAGVSPDYLRMNAYRYYYDYTARFVIEGTISDVSFLDYITRVTINDFNVLAGSPKYFSEEALSGKEHLQLSSGNDYNYEENAIRFMELNNYGISDYTFNSMNEQRFINMEFGQLLTDEVMHGLTVGDRYVFVGRIDENMGLLGLSLRDMSSEPWVNPIINITDTPDNYLDTDEFADLRNLIDITMQDTHTFDVVYTDDLATVNRFARGKMAVTEGRSLTADDNVNGAEVCVISRKLAIENGLEVGDTLTLDLGDKLFDINAALGAVASIPQRYAAPVKTVALEIVGLYSDMDSKIEQKNNPELCYSQDTVFVPLSLIAVDEASLKAYEPKPGAVSFVIDDARQIQPFLNVFKPWVAENGFYYDIDDGGWLAIENNFNSTQSISLISIIVVTIAILLAVVFVVYIFILRKKKEYSIMRALGVPRGKASFAMVFPLVTVGVFAVFLGSIVALMFVNSSIADAITTLSKTTGIIASTAIPSIVVISCIVGELVLLLGVSCLGLYQLSKQPPLALLQGGTKMRTVNSPLPDSGISQSYKHSTLAAFTYPDERNYNPLLFITNYIARHIIRQRGKSLLSFLLAAALFAAAGQFAVMTRSYKDLFDSMQVSASFMDGLPMKSCLEIVGTGNVEPIYYGYEGIVDIEMTTAEFMTTNSVIRQTGIETVIEYTDGYDDGVLFSQEQVCLLGGTLMDSLELNLGDTVKLNIASGIVYYTLVNENNPLVSAYDLEQRALEDYNKSCLFFTVAGRINSENDKMNNMIVAPASPRLSELFRLNTEDIFLEQAEFVLKDNSLADEFRRFADGIVQRDKGRFNASANVVFYMDTAQVDSIGKTLRLLETLFPVVVGVIVFIAAALPALIIMQSSKEASIMRVLGTTKRRSRAMLSAEQILLCVIGLCVGILALYLYNGNALRDVTSTLMLCVSLYFAGCIVGTVFAAVTVTRRNILELLQTKE